MKIAITSGKGGSGKTFVGTNLAAAFSGARPVRYIDCDVEAPNGHLFLKPQRISQEDQFIGCLDGVDENRCNGCGRCAEACYFNALAVMAGDVLVFPELCHWCGACLLACPEDAFLVGKRKIGTLLRGEAGSIRISWALLETSAGSMSPRLIRELKKQQSEDLTILDSPPGTSCPVVETVRGADLAILVADATPFGRHDLKLSTRMCRSMGIEPVVVVNRSGTGDIAGLHRWCASERLQIIGELPDSREVAELYSAGKIVFEHLPEFRKLFEDLACKCLESLEQTRDVPETNTQEQFFPDVTGKPTVPPGSSEGNSKPPEVSVVSGKGGVGKTSIAACFAQMSGGTVADCDVDAADMHMLIQPEILAGGEFCGGRTMEIDSGICTQCGNCIEHCRFDAISEDSEGRVSIDPELCEGCGACRIVCPADAVAANSTKDGWWYWSSTRFAEMSHAALLPGAENSGRLVTLIRRNATTWTDTADGRRPVVLDASPGTGCPVIASVGGAAFAVIVTEPTVSGAHDLQRILALTRYFNVPAGVIINKADLNPDQADSIRAITAEHEALILGELPYTTLFTEAQQAGRTLLEYRPESQLASAIRDIWKKTTGNLQTERETE